MRNIDAFKHVKIDELARLAHSFNQEENSKEALRMILAEINKRLENRTPFCILRKGIDY